MEFADSATTFLAAPPLVSKTYQNRTSVGAEQILLIRFKGNNENHAIETVTFFAQLIVVNVKVIADG